MKLIAPHSNLLSPPYELNGEDFETSRLILMTAVSSLKKKGDVEKRVWTTWGQLRRASYLWV